ncbi:hypothetical protein D9613_012313 [Agrocybe pediades]|uniref:Peptidase M14 domain-containing protein n=1 Tax=Agrocybe pediades TaxID=84607 RepID=A0A8H4VIZ4_9AGAR|nr:hypothetical protein D9613_012313 [Agrocybe pediades]
MGLWWLVLGSLLSHGLCEQHVLQNTVSSDGMLNRFDAAMHPEVLAVAQEHDLDIWHATDSFVDIYLPPDSQVLPEGLARLPHTTTSIPTAITSSRQLDTDWTPESLTNSSFHESYHPLDEIESFLEELTNVHSNITRLTTIGQSAEGRDIYALSISTGGYPSEEKKKKKKTKKGRISSREKLGFVIIGAQHAREWIATATSTYLAHAVVANSSEPHSMSNLLAHFDFHIVPVPNPDGYAYTWEKDRYWYKNRQIIGPHEKCVGVDMNRNWARLHGYKWKAHAIDRGVWKKDNSRPREPTNPCSHWYPGTRPFETPEVNSIANWVATLPNVAAFVDLRSYGQMLSSPYSYTCKRLPKDAEDQIEAAYGASHALKSVHGTEFRAGGLCSMLYAAPGNIIDWMYAREAIKYSYVAHLRDTGTYGFSLPEKWIRPTGEETVSLVEYLAKFIAKQAKSV